MEQGQNKTDLGKEGRKAPKRTYAFQVEIFAKNYRKQVQNICSLISGSPLPSSVLWLLHDLFRNEYCVHLPPLKGQELKIINSLLKCISTNMTFICINLMFEEMRKH